jgi:hypothetical protein
MWNCVNGAGLGGIDSSMNAPFIDWLHNDSLVIAFPVGFSGEEMNNTEYVGDIIVAVIQSGE